MDVPALILILCNPLDRSDCSFAKDLLQVGTHTALIDRMSSVHFYLLKYS